MDFSPYVRIVHDLSQYPEFRAGLQLLRGLLLVGVGVLVMLAVLHMLYYLGRRTPMYRKKPPADGWNRRFFTATTGMLLVLLLAVWGLDAVL